MKVNLVVEINRKTVTAFLAGVLLTACAAVYTFRNLQVTLKHARVAYETDNSATIIFYHDHTEQVLRIKVPIEKYPIPGGGRAVINTPTVAMWVDDDMEAGRLMTDNAFDALQEELRWHK